MVFGLTQTFPNKQVKDNVGGEALGLRVPCTHPESVPCPENEEPRAPLGREPGSGMAMAPKSRPRGSLGMLRRGLDVDRK